MIQKFKDLMQVSKNLEEVDSKLNSLNEGLSSLRSEFDSLKQSFGEVKDTADEAAKAQKHLLQNFRENVDSISEIKNDFKEEIFNFKLLKNQMQKKIMEKFAEEIENEIAQRKEEIKIDSGNYKEAKDAIEGFAGHLGAANQQEA